MPNCENPRKTWPRGVPNRGEGAVAVAVGAAVLEAVRILAQKDQSNGIDRPTDSAFCQLG
jgi:hypothetical protein